MSLEERKPQCLGDLASIPNVKISKCRLCGSGELSHLFSLGDHYVNDFVEKDKVLTGPKCPITLLLCKNCSLVQQEYSAPQEILYTRHYWYYSGVTQTMRDSLRDICRAAEQTVELKEEDAVLDIGSNDGTLLRSYSPEKKIKKYGFEPAVNLHEEGSKGVDYLFRDFWSFGRYNDYNTDPQHMGPKCKVVTAIGMFYDLEDPNQFIGDVAKVLHRDGVFIAQLMCLKNMLNLKDVGNLAHEHLEFYSLESLDYLFGAHGLEMFDIEKNQVNGESYRLYVRHKGSFHVLRPGGMRRLVEARMDEHDLDWLYPYEDFFTQLEKNKNDCVEFIKNAVANGKQVAILGASTKGNTILQYYGLDHTLIDHASERSPDKVGKYTVGTGIPIYSEEASRELDPDFYLVLPYAFSKEIMEREREWRSKDSGRRFLIPLPDFKVV